MVPSDREALMAGIKLSLAHQLLGDDAIFTFCELAEVVPGRWTNTMPVASAGNC